MNLRTSSEGCVIDKIFIHDRNVILGYINVRPVGAPSTLEHHHGSKPSAAALDRLNGAVEGFGVSSRSLRVPQFHRLVKDCITYPNPQRDAVNLVSFEIIIE